MSGRFVFGQFLFGKCLFGRFVFFGSAVVFAVVASVGYGVVPHVCDNVPVPQLISRDSRGVPVMGWGVCVCVCVCVCQCREGDEVESVRVIDQRTRV